MTMHLRTGVFKVVSFRALQGLNVLGFQVLCGPWVSTPSLCLGMRRQKAFLQIKGAHSRPVMNWFVHSSPKKWYANMPCSVLLNWMEKVQSALWAHSAKVMLAGKGGSTGAGAEAKVVVPGSYSACMRHVGPWGAAIRTCKPKVDELPDCRACKVTLLVPPA